MNGTQYLVNQLIGQTVDHLIRRVNDGVSEQAENLGMMANDYIRYVWDENYKQLEGVYNFDELSDMAVAQYLLL